MDAVNKSWEAIKHIKNPDKDVQINAVCQSWRAIRYIENPCKEAQLKAVSQEWMAIAYIRNIDKDVKEYIARNDAVAGMCVEYDFANDPRLQEILAFTRESHEEYEMGMTLKSQEFIRGENEERERYYRVSR